MSIEEHELSAMEQKMKQPCTRFMGTYTSKLMYTILFMLL